MLAGRRSELQLNLNLNRSISEPGQAELRSCLMEAKVLSLPASPCDESTSIHRAALIKKTKVWTSQELAKRLARKSRSFILLDCRSFISFNLAHICGAININCSDRMSRRRLIQGKVTLLDLAGNGDAKEAMKRRGQRDVVVYDDSSQEMERLPSTHPIYVVLQALVDDNRDPILLKGGLKDFHKMHSDLCESSLMSTIPVLSPCTPSPDLFPLLHDPSDIDNHPISRITPFLYVGNARDASNLTELRAMGISRVLNVNSCAEEVVERDGILFKTFTAADSGQQNLSQYFDDAIEFIEAARQSDTRVLVHCHAGVSRSPTIALAYLMKHFEMPLQSAYKLLKSKRSIISPNLNFMGQLLDWEDKLTKTHLKHDPWSKNPETEVASCGV